MNLGIQVNMARSHDNFLTQLLCWLGINDHFNFYQIPVTVFPKVILSFKYCINHGVKSHVLSGCQHIIDTYSIGCVRKQKDEKLS